jgi:hypothetical protein
MEHLWRRLSGCLEQLHVLLMPPPRALRRIQPSGLGWLGCSTLLLLHPAKVVWASQRSQVIGQAQQRAGN